jgi:hypothetical protein
MRSSRFLAATLACALACACGSRVKDDPGADAYLRVPGASFVRGPMPGATPGAPAVASIVVVNAIVHPDTVGYPIAGALGPGSTAAAIGVAGDTGYWVVPAGLPSVATPDDPSFSASATFASGLVAGQYALVVEAVDAQGRFGAPATQTLTAQAAPGEPQGALVVTLTWDTEADLDLHVVDPSGQEIFHGAMSDQPPPFAAPLDGGSYGFLDWDSNANCVIDGKRQESVVWPDAPPPGSYVIRVDAASMCGQAVARWTVEATLDGTSIGRAEGVAVDASTRAPHDRGAGVTALDLAVPAVP